MNNNRHRFFCVIFVVFLLILSEGLQLCFLHYGIQEAQAASIKSVQRGSQTMGVTPTTVTINPVVTANSFVICDFRMTSSAPNRLPTCELTDPTSLVITTGAVEATEYVNWQVVEFTSGVSVQRGLTTLAGGTGSVDIPITAVDTSKSFVLVTRRVAASDQANDEFHTIRAQLTNPTTLQLTRNDTTNDIPVAWQVITIDYASVQSNLTTINAGSATATATISSVCFGSGYKEDLDPVWESNDETQIAKGWVKGAIRILLIAIIGTLSVMSPIQDGTAITFDGFSSAGSFPASGRFK